MASARIQNGGSSALSLSGLQGILLGSSQGPSNRDLATACVITCRHCLPRAAIVSYKNLSVPTCSWPTSLSLSVLPFSALVALSVCVLFSRSSLPAPFPQINLPYSRSVCRMAQFLSGHLGMSLPGTLTPATAALYFLTVFPYHNRKACQ